ncbi:hypothetical protein [Microvirga makkahensis]|uniref:C-type lysozyme inhibitor domain-containing protein n=1 Tax=Microvirga makkahensis TaxID=1128670 RepID=A0A7X3MVX0_9HYPH|nr:hypothetical protein [Microvirga makkahensis]MXQ14100.1 hypothetical protein [Microvirga makkahensis]
MRQLGLVVLLVTGGSAAQANPAHLALMPTAEPTVSAASPDRIALAHRSSGDETKSRCRPIKFKAGGISATVSGTVKAETRDRPVDPLCYSLAVSDGQRVQVRLLSGTNVAIAIEGIGDANDAFDFVTRSGTYELRVFTLFPMGQHAPFRMRIEVSPPPDTPRLPNSSEGLPDRAAASPAGKLRGRWLGLHRRVRFPLGCDSGEPVFYSQDGKYMTEGVIGTWRLQGNRLTETATEIAEPGEPGAIGRPHVSRIAWEGPDKFVKTFPDGSRMTFRRCPS